jgi:predicted O-methyltransferase YrrM
MNSTTGLIGQNRFARAIDRRIQQRYQRFIFWRAMRRFTRDLWLERRNFDHEVLSELVKGWGNRWSAQHEYLAACLEQVRDADGPILECGSGLSTILIGTVAQASGNKVLSLEHEPKYAFKVQRYLDKYHLTSVKLYVAPLTTYGDFDWYSPPPLDSITEKFSVVVCDGPPETTRGRRYGLVPVMLEKLRPDCTILLDDGAREGERETAERWAKVLGGVPEMIGTEKPYIRLKVAQPTPHVI